MTEDKPITEEEVAELAERNELWTGGSRTRTGTLVIRLIADWQKRRERVEEFEICDTERRKTVAALKAYMDECNKEIDDK